MAPLSGSCGKSGYCDGMHSARRTDRELHDLIDRDARAMLAKAIEALRLRSLDLLAEALFVFASEDGKVNDLAPLVLRPRHYAEVGCLCPSWEANDPDTNDRDLVTCGNCLCHFSSSHEEPGTRFGDDCPECGERVPEIENGNQGLCTSCGATFLRVDLPPILVPVARGLVGHADMCPCWRCVERAEGQGELSFYRSRDVDPTTCAHPSDDRSPLSGDGWLCDHCGADVCAPSDDERPVFTIEASTTINEGPCDPDSCHGCANETAALGVAAAEQV